MTIQLTLNDREWCMVPVPEDAENIKVVNYDGKRVILHSLNMTCGIGPNGLLPLPPGNWQLHCVSDSIDEKLAAEIVEVGDYPENPNPNPYFKNYLSNDGDYAFATGSLKSLLQHHSLTGRIAALVRVK